ncbi:carboxymuconolactone decarboxylase family protein [Actinoplanes sp. URMC 104]|uniref:carboxymuconolactone decarboxylase family protein n=1 Tax=Actinoplanes sp. URMC 104 TaxID=3423409 RepID=UPI003F1A6918
MTERLGAELQPAVLDRAAGQELLTAMQDPQTYAATIPALEELAPGFADWIVTCLFGGTYQRGVLSARDRQIATLSALAVLGSVEPQLVGHIRTALRLGLQPREVTEVFVHLAPYVGTPRALAALRCARQVYGQ